VSKYYESGKPFTRTQWNLLIGDLNELFQNPPGVCEAIDEIDEADVDHVWTKGDVEEVREKMMELCPDIEFDWEGEPLLEKPWSEEIIDEIEDQMDWCDCGANEYQIAEIHPELGECFHEAGDRTADTLESVVSGMQVASEGHGGLWSVYTLRHTFTLDEQADEVRTAYAQRHGEPVPFLIGRSLTANRIANGTIDCNGQVDWGSNPPGFISPGYFVDYECWPEDECVLQVEPPIWWFGPGWAEEAQAQFEACQEELEARRQGAIDDAQEFVDRLNNEVGEWLEYVLVVNDFGLNPDCEEE
jgi:hypothetical protein